MRLDTEMGKGKTKRELITDCPNCGYKLLAKDGRPLKEPRLLTKDFISGREIMEIMDVTCGHLLVWISGGEMPPPDKHVREGSLSRLTHYWQRRNFFAWLRTRTKALSGTGPIYCKENLTASSVRQVLTVEDVPHGWFWCREGGVRWKCKGIRTHRRKVYKKRGPNKKKARKWMDSGLGI